MVTFLAHGKQGTGSLMGFELTPDRQWSINYKSDVLKTSLAHF